MSRTALGEFEHHVMLALVRLGGRSRGAPRALQSSHSRGLRRRLAERNYKRMVLWLACFISVSGSIFAFVTTASSVTNGVRLLVSIVLLGAAGMMALLAPFSASANYFC